MPTIESLKQAVCARIDERRRDIVALSAEVLAHPESGYREQATAQRVAQRLAAMSLEPRVGLAGEGSGAVGQDAGTFPAGGIGDGAGGVVSHVGGETGIGTDEVVQGGGDFSMECHATGGSSPL